MTDADRDGRGAETTTESGGGAVLSGLMRPLNNLVERFIPSALVFAIVLTFVVVLLALLLTDAGPVSVVEERSEERRVGKGGSAGWRHARGTERRDRKRERGRSGRT